MPYSVDSPPSAARKYKPKCQRAFVHAFNSVYDRTKDDGKAMAAGHAAAQQCEGKRSSMTDIQKDVKFKIFTDTLKAVPMGEDGIRRLKTTASSTIRDLSGDTMTLKALQRMVESATQNMTIWLNHKYEVPESVLGSVETAEIHQRGTDVWDLDFGIRVEEENPRAVSTHKMIENGTKLGTSIGAKIPKGGAKMTDDGLLIDDVQLLEASIVGIPANPRSFVQYAVKAYEEAMEDGESEDNEAVVETEKAKVWVTVDTEDTAQADDAEEKPVTGKAKDKKKDAEPELVKDEAEGPPAENAEASDVAEATVEHAETADSPPAEGDEAAGDEAAEGQPDNTEAPATQEAPQSDPESDGDGDESASELLGKSIDVIQRVLASRTEELAAERQKTADLTSELATKEAELGEAKEGLKLAQKIVERIAALPIGKRAGFAGEVSDFRTKFGELYDSEFLKMLEK